MGFDPLNSGDYHKFESTSGSGSGGGKPSGSNGSPWCWQAVLGWVIMILAVVVLVCGTIANMPR